MEAVGKAEIWWSPHRGWTVKVVENTSHHPGVVLLQFKAQTSGPADKCPRGSQTRAPRPAVIQAPTCAPALQQADFWDHCKWRQLMKAALYARYSTDKQ